MIKELTREEILSMASKIDIARNPITGNYAAVIPQGKDNADYKAYIINSEGTVTKVDDVGFNYWCVVPSATQYLTTYERYCDRDYAESIELMEK